MQNNFDLVQAHVQVIKMNLGRVFRALQAAGSILPNFNALHPD